MEAGKWDVGPRRVGGAQGSKEQSPAVSPQDRCSQRATEAQGSRGSPCPSPLRSCWVLVAPGPLFPSLGSPASLLPSPTWEAELEALEGCWENRGVSELLRPHRPPHEVWWGQRSFCSGAKGPSSETGMMGPPRGLPQRLRQPLCQAQEAPCPMAEAGDPPPRACSGHNHKF